MLTLIIMVLILFGFLRGLKRGFILQVFHLIGFVIAFIVARMYYSKLSGLLQLWIPYPDLTSDGNWATILQSLPLETGFYNAVSFVIIFFVVKVIVQIIASMLDFVAELPILNSLNKLLGAGLGFIEVYLVLFIILFILALTPIPMIQDLINHSSLAKFMIESTPFLSEKIKTLWFTVATGFFG